VRRVLVAYHYPMNYAALFFVAAILLGIASLGLWRIREIPASNFKISGFKNFIDTILQEIRINKKWRSYLFLTNTQGISIVLMPFLVLYAKKLFSADSQDIGNFLVLKVIGGILSGSVLFYFSGKVRYQVMLYVTTIIAILIPLFILLLPGPTLFPYVFLLGGIVYTIHTISINGILLEVTTEQNRALYTGLSGAGSIFPVIFPFLGGWIISEFGFNLFFGLFITIMIMSIYFIRGVNCKV